MLKSKTSKFSRTGLILFSALIVYSIFTSAASAGTATLSWSPPTTNADGSPLTDLAGYKVYYGTSSKTYTSSVNVGNVTSYTTANLADGTYYFAVTAIDTSNIESGYSNEASKTITTTVTAVSTGTATLSWTPPANNTDGSQLTDLAGYKVYYGTSSKTYTSSVNVGNVTSYTTASLPAGTYYFAITSYDTSGNESAYSTEASKSIGGTGGTADTTPPTGTISINSGAAYTNNTATSLALSCSDAGGCSQMQFSNDNATWSTAEAYSTTKSWTLTSTNGTKTVYAKFKDNAGNWSTAYTDTITLDTIAPSGSIAINNGAAYTRSTTITLGLNSTDSSGLSQMCVSNTTSCSSWETYATSKSWTLPSGDGTKTVYASFKDKAGNVSSAFSDSIIIDTVPPIVTIGSGVSTTGADSQTIYGTVESGASVYVSTDTAASDGAATLSGTSWSYSVTGLVAGVNNITVTAKDAAGNTATASTSITLNAPLFTSTSPASSAFINTGTVGYTISRAANTGTITFTRTGGSADLTSPYVYNFTASDVTAGTHSVNTGINLVSGAVYSIVFDATDLSGKKESATISNVTYDAKAASVVINSPVSNSIVNNASVSYTLSENLLTGEIVFTGNDGISTHTYEMTSADRTAGAHTVNTSALLLDGVFYTLTFQNVTDLAGNPTSAVSNTNIKYDSTSVVISNTTPVPGSAITSATVGYTLSEQASTGKVTFTRTGGKNDRNSPQVYYFNYSDLAAGAHIVNTNLPLVRGTTYTVSFDAVDLIGNKSTTVSNGEVTYKGR